MTSVFLAILHHLRLLSASVLLALVAGTAAAQDGTAEQPAAEQPSAGQPAAPPQPFRLGAVPNGDVRAFLEALEPFREGVAGVLGRPVEILPVASLSALVDAQILQRIDGGFYSATAYAAAEALCACLEPLVAPAAADGTTAYHGIIVARRDAGTGSVADLQGKRIAAGPADSVAARKVPLASLEAEGFQPETFFASLIDAGSAVAAVRMVLERQADAAFAWSSLQGDVERGYSRGTLAFLVARGELAMDDIVIVWRSRPISHGPFAVLRSLPQEERAALEAYLVGLSDAEPELYDRLDVIYGGGFRPVEPADYRAVALTVGRDPTPEPDSR